MTERVPVAIGFDELWYGVKS